MWTRIVSCTLRQRLISRAWLGLLTGLALAWLVASDADAESLRVLVTGLGEGSVGSSPGAISCGSTCDDDFATDAPVTLTAGMVAGSTFVRWEGDCSGSASTCALVMDADKSVRAVYDLDVAIPTIADFTPAGLQTYLDANPAVNDAARFLAALPADFRRNWIFMTRSESLQTGTARHPRILLPSIDAEQVFTFGTVEHASYPGAHPKAVEYMQWDAAQKNFRFHEIVLDAIPAMGTVPARTRQVTADDPKCTRCHSTRNVLNPGTGPGTTGVEPGLLKAKNKPNWDSYDSWGGMTPFNRDRIYKGSLEAAAFRQLMNPWTWRDEPLVRAVIGQLELQPTCLLPPTCEAVPSGDVISRIEGGPNDGHIVFPFDDTEPVLTEPSPTGTSINVSYAFDRAAGTPPGSAVVRNEEFLVLRHEGLPADTDEGRGVHFFDLLGGFGNTPGSNLNAQRIADEVIDHRWATGSIPIEIRPVALGVAKECFAIDREDDLVNGVGATLTIDLSFFNDRHGMGINQLVADTRERAESMPRRKADNQALNLDRDDDPYLNRTPAAGEDQDGLVLAHGAGTAAGTDTMLPRLRQEVFRRPVDLGRPDQTVMGGILVDREKYGTNPDPTSADYTNLNTDQVALFRYFLEPLGVSVDKWSMGVRGRSRTYAFADVFGRYPQTLIDQIEQSLVTNPVPGLASPFECDAVIGAVNTTLGSLPPSDQMPTFTDVQRIFNKGCIECHGGLEYPPYANYSGGAASGIDFSEDELPPAGSDRLDRAHATAAVLSSTNPATSYLYQRVTDDYRFVDPADATKLVPYDATFHNEDCPNFTDLMPCGGPPISQADMLTLRRWIDGPDGLPNTRGDPHIRTVDGVNYDFQAAGEFVWLKGPGLEIQARQTAVDTAGPLGPNAHTGLTSCVSINTAAAVRTGRHSVSLQPEHTREVTHATPPRLALRIDGKVTKLGPDGVRLADGGRVRPADAEGGIRIEGADGSVINITPQFWSAHQVWFMNIDARHVRATRGLAGQIAPNNWLPALPNGSWLGPRPATPADRYDQLYHQFGDAWRVTDATSLFSYPAGLSTASFTIADWPMGDAPPACLVALATGETPTSTPPAMLDLAVAEQHCDGVVTAAARHNCIQDVRVTAEPAFALAYLASEAFELREPPATPELIFPPNRQAALPLPIEFSWRAPPDDEAGDIEHRLCVWPAASRLDLNQCRVLEAGTTPWDGVASPADWAWLLLLLLILLLIVLFLHQHPGRLVLALVLLALLVLLAWFWLRDSGGPDDGTQGHLVTGLVSGEDYNWKVIADDGHGGITHSRTQRFEVE